MADFDLVVIGGGPGGFSAAIRGAQRGAHVALVERGVLGGINLNSGGVLSKTLSATADLLQRIRRMSDLNWDAFNSTAAAGSLLDRRRSVTQRLGLGYTKKLKQLGVTLIQGTAQLAGNKTVAIARSTNDVVTISAENIILATGSRSVPPPGRTPDGIKILDCEQLSGLQDIPNRLLVLGGGYIGCEYASVFQSLGTQITLIESGDRLLPDLDADLGRGIERVFQKQNIRVLLNARVTETRTGGEVIVTLQDQSKLVGDKLLVCGGRAPNVENLGLQTEQIEMEDSFVHVDYTMRTSAGHVFAIGDLVGKSLLAHVAQKEGRIAADNATGGDAQMTYDVIPKTVFTTPEIGSVGLTEDQAARAGLSIVSGQLPLATLPRAVASNETDGFIKILAESTTHRIVGVHILGASASELLAAATLIIETNTTLESLANTVFAYSTLGEGLGQLAESMLRQRGLPDSENNERLPCKVS